MKPLSPNVVSMLRKLAQVGAQRDLSTDESLALTLAFDALLSQPADVEEALVSSLMDDLYDYPDALDYLLHEMEVASALAHIGKKQDKAVLLTALPVLYIAGSNPRILAQSTDSMIDVAAALSDSNVVSEHAQVALLPRLFRPEELAAQSYGTLRKLTQMMGEQLLAGDPVRMEPGIFNEGPHVLNPSMAWGDNPYVELYFVLGVVMSPVTELDGIFPEVGDDEEDEDGDGNDDARTPAQSWESNFFAAIDDAFFSMFGVQGSSLPTDIHEALREGFEMWRGCGLLQQLRMNFSSTEDLQIGGNPTVNSETGRYGWQLSFVDSSGDARDTCMWEVLHHESEEDAKIALEDLMAMEGIPLNPLSSVFPDQ